MYQSTQSIHPVQTIFCDYVPELHDVERHANLLPKDKLDFAAVLKSLRAALGVRPRKEECPDETGSSPPQRV